MNVCLSQRGQNCIHCQKACLNVDFGFSTMVVIHDHLLIGDCCAVELALDTFQKLCYFERSCLRVHVKKRSFPNERQQAPESHCEKLFSDEFLHLQSRLRLHKSLHPFAASDRRLLTYRTVTLKKNRNYCEEERESGMRARQPQQKKIQHRTRAGGGGVRRGALGRGA